MNKCVLNLNQFRVFYHAFKLGSFTAAASALGISQPAVSMQIDNFQNTLGLTLYRVDGRRIELTGAGRKLMEFGDHVFEIISRTEQHVISAREEQSYRLTISTTRTVAAYFLPRVMRAFNQLHKDVAIRIEMGSNDWAYHSVLDGASDLALVVNAKGHRSVSRRFLFWNPLVVIAAPSHPILANKWDPHDFSSAMLILREKGAKTRETVERYLGSADVKIGQTMELADVEAIKSLVRTGVGISILPEISVQEEVLKGTLAKRIFLDGKVRLRFDAVYQTQTIAPPSKAFLRALLAQLSST